MTASPIATAFVAASCARPLRAWSHAQQEEVQHLLHQLVRSWQMAWGLSHAEGETTQLTVRVPKVAVADEQTVYWRFEEWPAADLAQTALRALQTALFGDSAHLTTVSGAAVIAPEITRVAWNDWQQRLASTLHVPLSAWPADGDQDHAADAWSGTLSVHLEWCGTRCTLLLPGPVVQKLLRPAAPQPAVAPQPLAPLTDALQDQRLDVRARLRDVTLTLGELEQLSPGDVLLLPHRLDAPLQILGPDEEALCHAWLGQQAGRIALELSPLATPA